MRVRSSLSGTGLSVMELATLSNLDYLAARLHGRRSQLAEKGRLAALGELGSFAELTQATHPASSFPSPREFQRRLVQDLAGEVARCRRHLEGPAVDLLAWTLARFQVDNLKLVIRCFVNGRPWEVIAEHLILLPGALATDLAPLKSASSLQELVERLPRGAPRRSLRELLAVYQDQPRPFFLEAALDRGYFQELLARSNRLTNDDKELVRPMILHEVDMFHLMLVLRGKFFYGLPEERLLPLHVCGSGIPLGRFRSMLEDADALTAAQRAVGYAIDALPPEAGPGGAGETVDLAALEALAGKRFWRLANRAFRRSLAGAGLVLGYIGLRRVEVTNLISVSEALRLGVRSERIRPRMIPRAEPSV